MTEGSPRKPRTADRASVPSPHARSVPTLEAPSVPSPLARSAPFAHASEAELARILDYYQIRWHYEPRSFPIRWTLEGKVVESFAPDFYLPDLDLYVELTTLKQSLVRKKNRKLRRLRELYPEIRIKLFYAKDFRALMLKYGKGALVGELSGAGGQFGLPGAVRAARDAGTELTAEEAVDAEATAGPAPGRVLEGAPGGARSVDAAAGHSRPSRARRASSSARSGSRGSAGASGSVGEIR